MWATYGKPEKPYTVRDIQTTLASYTSSDFANTFFENYIYKSGFPDYEKLLASMGVTFAPAAPGKAYLGVSLRKTDKGLTVSSYTKINSPAYKAGLESGDLILTADGNPVNNEGELTALVEQSAPGKEMIITYKRQNTERTAKVLLEENPARKTALYEDAGLKPDAEKLKRRAAWLNPK
jgi:predicted metalloprotease with PDZ domain